MQADAKKESKHALGNDKPQCIRQLGKRVLLKAHEQNNGGSHGEERERTDAIPISPHKTVEHDAVDGNQQKPPQLAYCQVGSSSGSFLCPAYARRFS